MQLPLPPPKPSPLKHRVRVEPAYVTQFIQMCLPAARQVKAKWRVPIAVLIGQGATESGWGRAVVDNAYFGIKGKVGGDDTVVFGTTEYLDGKKESLNQTFRAYKDLEEAADDYGRFLSVNPRFKAAFLYTNDPLNFVHEVAKANYASGPKYEETVGAIIKFHHLEQYDKP